METGNRVLYSADEGINLLAAGSHHWKERDMFCSMTLLPWKRTDRGSGSQTSAFEELALPLLPWFYSASRIRAHDRSL